MSDVPNQAKIAAQKGNDVSWQDELRAKVQRMLDSETDPYAAGVLVAVQMCIDDTAAEHPGLCECPITSCAARKEATP